MYQFQFVEIAVCQGRKNSRLSHCDRWESSSSGS